MQISDFTFLIEKIQAGSICVMPTDTVYGLVAAANLPDAVERAYKLKGRVYDKPFIVLLSDASQLAQFSVKINEHQSKALSKLWPGPVSVILPCEDESLAYLHRGKNSIAFRIPKLLWLRELVANTGPIVATSANKSGNKTSDDISRIMRELPEADLYVEGPVSETPSKLARLQDDGAPVWINRG